MGRAFIAVAAAICVWGVFHSGGHAPSERRHPEPSAVQQPQKSTAESKENQRPLTEEEAKAQGLLDIQKAGTRVNERKIIQDNEDKTRDACKEIIMRDLDTKMNRVEAVIGKTLPAHQLMVLLVHETAGGNVERFGKTKNTSATGAFQILMPSMAEFLKEYGKGLVAGVTELEGEAVGELLARTTSKLKAMSASEFKNFKECIGNKETDKAYVPPDNPLARDVYALALNTGVSAALVGRQLEAESTQFNTYLQAYGQPWAKLLFQDKSTRVWAVQQLGFGKSCSLVRSKPMREIGTILGGSACEKNKINPSQPVIDFCLQNEFHKTVVTSNVLKTMMADTVFRQTVEVAKAKKAEVARLRAEVLEAKAKEAEAAKQKAEAEKQKAEAARKLAEAKKEQQVASKQTEVLVKAAKQETTAHKPATAQVAQNAKPHPAAKNDPKKDLVAKAKPATNGVQAAKAKPGEKPVNVVQGHTAKKKIEADAQPKKPVRTVSFYNGGRRVVVTCDV